MMEIAKQTFSFDGVTVQETITKVDESSYCLTWKERAEKAPLFFEWFVTEDQVASAREQVKADFIRHLAARRG